MNIFLAIILWILFGFSPAPEVQPTSIGCNNTPGNYCPD